MTLDTNTCMVHDVTQEAANDRLDDHVYIIPSQKWVSSFDPCQPF